MAGRRVVIGTRGSALALIQAGIVAGALRMRDAALEVEVRAITTKGDRLHDTPLRSAAMRGAFVDAIDTELRNGAIDVAVHSAKDMPSTPPHGLAIAAFLERADPRDVLVSSCGALAELPAGALVGTSSQRRVSALRGARPDLRIVELRGNVDTRLRKLDAGAFNAIVLAGAGLSRLGLAARISEWLPTSLVLPSPGQGAIAVEARADDREMLALALPLAHAPTTDALTAERAFLARLGSGCAAAVGALAKMRDGRLTLEATIGAVDGRSMRAQSSDPPQRADALGTRLADEMLATGGHELLQEAANGRPA